MRETSPETNIDAVMLRMRNELGDPTRAAWIIDPRAARLFAVNPAGAHLFRQTGDASNGIALDSAMPAVTTLRRLIQGASKKRGAARRESLLFWTPSGPRRHLCDVSIHRHASRIFCLVQDTEAAAPAALTLGSEPSPDVERDDATTLKEIARRIRSGIKQQPLAFESHDDFSETHRDLSNKRTEQDNSQRPAIAATTATSTAMDQDQRAKLAHELRTPIGAIAAASEIMKDERFGAIENFRYRGYVRDIYQSAQHALSVIERFFEGTEPHSVSSNITSSSFDLNEVVEHCVSSVAHLAERKRQSMSFGPSPIPARLHADVTMTKQIIFNLLTNAMKFTPAGGRIEVTVIIDTGAETRLEVRDTGCGMSGAEILHHLDPSQAIKPAPRTGGGLGIGLALSRQLAEANGARLDIASNPNQGTTAALIFPHRRLVAV